MALQIIQDCTAVKDEIIKPIVGSILGLFYQQVRLHHLACDVGSEEPWYILCEVVG